MYTTQWRFGGAVVCCALCTVHTTTCSKFWYITTISISLDMCTTTYHPVCHTSHTSGNYHSHHGVVNTCTYILHDNNNKEWQRNYCIFFLLVYNYSGRSNGLLDLTFLTHSHSHRIRHLSDDQLFPPSFTCAGLGTTDDVHHHHPPSKRPQPHCRFTSFLFTRSCTPMGQFHRAFHQC